MTADAASQNLSETYTYDELNRLIDVDRGQFIDDVFAKSSDYGGKKVPRTEWHLNFL